MICSKRGIFLGGNSLFWVFFRRLGFVLVYFLVYLIGLVGEFRLAVEIWFIRVSGVLFSGIVRW